MSESTIIHACYPRSEEPRELARSGTELARAAERSLLTHKATAERLNRLEQAVDKLENSVAKLALELAQDRASRNRTAAVLTMGIPIGVALVQIIVNVLTR